MPNLSPSGTRTIIRTVLIVVCVVLALYVIYLLRRPLSWIVIAAFIAVAAAGPVNYLQRHMKRGLAIAITYLTLILIPVGVLGNLIFTWLVTEDPLPLVNHQHEAEVPSATDPAARRR